LAADSNIALDDAEEILDGAVNTEIGSKPVEVESDMAVKFSASVRFLLTIQE